MDNYQEAEKFLLEQLPMFQRTGGAAYKADLTNINSLLDKLGRPEKGLKYIHVAGTNGKGSTSHALAAVLIKAGYKVGLFTSPHLKHFSERIKVNGQAISEANILEYVRSYQSFIDEIKPSFFELTTAMAFQHFQKEKVDIAIMEVGMGGRLDSTNVIFPELSIITQIDFDHQQFLGNTLEAITKEKAGIIKESTAVITSVVPDELRKLIKDIATERNADYHHSGSYFNLTHNGSNGAVFQYLVEDKLNSRSYEISSDLGGSYQAYNLQTVLASLTILNNKGYNINEESIRKGLEQVSELTGLKGRWQSLKHPDHAVKIIADTGHNKSAIEHIVQMLKKEVYDDLHIILGMVTDKDISPILGMLPKDANYYFTKANVPRALSEEILYQEASKSGLKGNSFTNVNLAFREALKNAKKNDLIFIGGSTFVVAEIPIL